MHYIIKINVCQDALLKTKFALLMSTKYTIKVENIGFLNILPSPSGWLFKNTMQKVHRLKTPQVFPIKFAFVRNW